MSNRYDPSTLSLDSAISIYLRSEYFTQLAPITRNKRRGWLRSLRAEVVRLAEGLSETPPPHPVLPPARSVPWLAPLTQNKRAEDLSDTRQRQPARRGSWTTA
jgi:hypothetical protein